jgi:signal transduction histidine kinase/CheY-like chemotaxis protein
MMGNDTSRRSLIFVREIRTPDEGIAAQQGLRQATNLLGLEGYEQTRLNTAAAELLREAGLPSGCPLALDLGIVVDEAGRARSLEVSLGLPRPTALRLRQSLTQGGSSNGSNDGADSPSGIVAARRLVDTLSFRDDEGPPGVVLGLRLDRGTAAALSPVRLAEVARELASQRAADPRAEIEHLTRELARRDEMLRALRGELEDTNRGVMSLYAELDERAEYQRRAADLKSRVLSDMGHEMRTPIHSILSISQFLLQRLDGELTDEQDKQVRIIRNTARDLAQFIDDLLDLAKAQAGKIPVRVEQFGIAQLFNTLRGIFRPRAQESSVPLYFDDPPEMPPLVTDESKLSQILRNFISNALKFTEQGEVRVSVAAGPGDTVTFSVTDTGIGVAPEHLTYVFEEFTQIDSPLQRRSKGTGLGLPLAKRLASLLGGEVSACSTMGGGSTFSATIPRVFVAPAEASAQATTALATTALATVQQLYRAVIIDDDEAARYVLRRRLGPSFSVVEASSGRAGIEATRALCPDVVFLDLRMPGLSGFDVLAMLAAEPATERIPVIIFTSQSLTDAEHQRLQRARAILDKAKLSEEGDPTLREALELSGIPNHVAPQQ